MSCDRSGFQLARSQMFHLKGINIALIDEGRFAQLGRATSISSASVTAIPLDPPSLTQLQQLLARQEDIALAIDEWRARLASGVTSNPVFDGDLLDELRSVIANDGQSHWPVLILEQVMAGDAGIAILTAAARAQSCYAA